MPHGSTGTRFLLLAILLAAAKLAAQAPAAAAGVDEYVKATLDEWTAYYRHLHANPELSFHEAETAKTVAAKLEAYGYEVARSVGGHGLVGVLKNGEGPVVMVRTDLDALPIVENTGLDFASKKKSKAEDGKEVGVMHACGHDVHMTVFTATARRFAETKSAWKGTLVFVGQPAEERGSGALKMIADGLFERFPRPARAIALHCSSSLPAGIVATCEGFALASVDSVDIQVRGVGGHGAYPHTTKDPIVLAAQIVLALQTLRSRETSPLEPSVLTVGSIHGGAKHNIISDEVKMEVTVRAYNDVVRKQILDGIRRIVDGCARAAGLPEDRMPVVKVLEESIGSTYNDPDLTKATHAALTKALGAERVRKADPVMGGEDFGCYGKVEPRIPICMFWLGVVDPEVHAIAEKEKKGLPSLHSAEFKPLARPTIETGIKAMCAAVTAALEASPR